MEEIILTEIEIKEKEAGEVLSGFYFTCIVDREGDRGTVQAFMK